MGTEGSTYAAQKALRDRYIRGKDGTNREYVVGAVIHRLPEVARVRQCLGHTQAGRRCARQAMASADGYYCSQHLWQDGVEEGSSG